MLVIGAGTYPKARFSAGKVPVLPDISSAAESALLVAQRAVTSWATRFAKPLASVDLLVCKPDGGTVFAVPSRDPIDVAEPTSSKLVAARDAWLQGASADDVLIFYCCGHGIWLPSRGRTFLPSDFGEDEEDPWPKAIWLDGFAAGLAEKPPRQQWLMYDCCANTPTQAMTSLAANPSTLVGGKIGGRGQAEDDYGSLSQVVVASAITGAQAFGKPGRPSRFAEALIEACEVSGYQTEDGGVWWIDPASLDKAIGSFSLRVANAADEAYYTFPRLVTTDATNPPLLLKRDNPSSCTVIITSNPQSRLTQGELVIRYNGSVVAQQAAGLTALARFRHNVEPWRKYQIQLTLDGAPVTFEKWCAPPFAKAVF